MEQSDVELFDAEIYTGRIERCRQLAREAGVDTVVIGPGSEFAYFTGSFSDSHERFTGLIIPAEGEPCVLAPEVDKRNFTITVPVRGWRDGEDPYSLAADMLPEARTIAIGTEMTAQHLFRFKDRMSGQFVPASQVIAPLVMRKSEAEAEQLRRAARAIDEVHERARALCVPGVTEREVAEKLHAGIVAAGHSSVDFVIVGSGDNGANPHHSYSDRVLSAGDPVVIDIGGTIGAGYHSDCTRTLIVPGEGGEADPEFMHAYEVLRRAHAAAIAAVRPGVTAEDVDKAAREVIAEAGYGEFFTHRTGHGIGLSLHEEPFIIAGNQLRLEPGMAFSVEPGIYVEGRWGARIEDIVIVTEDGCEVLNQGQRDL